YPPLAKAARVSGAVVVEVTLDEEGNVISAKALSGHPLLKDSAVAAAMKWRFAPTLLSGKPIKVVGALTFNFYLGNDSERLEALAKKVEENPSSADARYELGYGYVEAARFEEAIRELKEAVRLNPELANAHRTLGLAYLGEQHYQ